MKIETLISRLGDFSRDAVLITDVIEEANGQPTILWCNQAFCQMTGYSKEEIIGRAPDIFEGAETDPTRRAFLHEECRAGRAAQAEVLLYGKDSQPFWVECDINPVRNQAGKIDYWLARHRDVSEVKASEPAASAATQSQVSLESEQNEALSAAEIAETRLWSAINTLPDGFVLYDKDNRLIIANEAFLSLHETFRDEIVPGISFKDITRRGIETGLWTIEDQDPEEWSKGILKKGDSDQSSYVIKMADGRWFQRNDRRLPNGDRVGIRIDVTEIKAQQEALERSTAELEANRVATERRALTDELTGLMNRRGLEQHLAERLETDRDTRLMIILINLDRFKQINDTMGYEAGNHVLCDLVKTLNPFIGANDRLARLGGDEFVLVREVSPRDVSSQEIARRILQAVAQPILYQDRPCRVSACLGIAYERDGTRNGGELLLDADVALNRAQQQGRGQIEIYSHQITLELEEKKRTADEILDGLEQGAFFPVYQPQFDSKTLEVVGVEALARWRHPTRGVLSPAAFLPIAEEMNVLSDIDALIFERAVADMRKLNAAGIDTPRLSVNISLKRLCDPGLLASIDRLDISGLKIAFELLETIFLDDEDEDFDWTIDQLQERGIDIELDDFGSGRASIVGLTRVKPKRMKIDRQLVIPILDDESRLNLLKAIVSIGRSLEIGVTAEGVETMQHIAHLREMGCDTVQGFGLARPMPFVELQNVLLTTGCKLNIEA